MVLDFGTHTFAQPTNESMHDAVEQLRTFKLTLELQIYE